MEQRNFRQLLEAQWVRGNCVSVGLDPDLAKIPESIRQPDVGETFLVFAKAIIDATKDIVGAYKPNSAFYEAYGDVGLRALRDTIRYVHSVAPTVPVILDAKRADIGNTNLGYAQEAFDFLEADALTVHPYLGAEALQPFLDRKDKGVIVLCKTSNPGAGEFQDLLVDRIPLYRHIAQRVATVWNKNGNCALVVGATYSKELGEVRRLVGDMPILIPGIGAQGGNVKETVLAGKDSRGYGMIINSSRGIIFASSGADFAEAARRETIKLREEINRY